jgi:hypothetical protein
MGQRTERFVQSVRGWCEANGVRNVDLARTLGISPQAVWNIFNQASGVTGETALHLQEIISRTNMNHDEPPRTLFLAKERIAELTAEIAQLKRASAGTSTPAPTPAASIKPATLAAAVAACRGTGMVFNPPPPTAPMTQLDNRDACNQARDLCDAETARGRDLPSRFQRGASEMTKTICRERLVQTSTRQPGGTAVCVRRESFNYKTKP